MSKAPKITFSDAIEALRDFQRDQTSRLSEMRTYLVILCAAIEGGNPQEIAVTTKAARDYLNRA